MIKVGLTGGIGSGKTTIAQFFEIIGISVYYSDVEAKSLMTKNLLLKKKLINLLGKNVYQFSGELNKEYISKQIFANSQILKKINSIVHPFVEDDFNRFCINNINSSYIIKESAILIETGLYKNLDKIILITADTEKRIQRVVARDQLSEKNIQERMNKQYKDQEKIKYSDYIISNNNQEFIIPQILDIHHRLSHL